MNRLIVGGALIAALVGCADAHPSADAGPEVDGGADSGVDSGRDAAVVDGGGGGTDGGARDGGPLIDTGVGSVCAVATDCVVVPASCCGSCGAPSSGDAVALHRDDALAYRRGVCGDQLCPACAQDDPPHLLADCVGGACVLVDLMNDSGQEWSGCESDDDCTLRTRDCCPCGADIVESNLVAIRQDRYADFGSLVCEPGASCPECEPSYEPYFTWCGADTAEGPRRCRVDVVGP